MQQNGGDRILVDVFLHRNEYGGGCVNFVVLGIILVVGCCCVAFLFSF